MIRRWWWALPVTAVILWFVPGALDRMLLASMLVVALASAVCMAAFIGIKTVVAVVVLGGILALSILVGAPL